jgi:hypothetical protein
MLPCLKIWLQSSALSEKYCNTPGVKLHHGLPSIQPMVSWAAGTVHERMTPWYVSKTHHRRTILSTHQIAQNQMYLFVCMLW